MLNNRVLILADPNSIHTKKWADGWNMLGYDTATTGLSKNN